MSKISNELARMLMETSDWSAQKEVKAKLTESTETKTEEVVEEAVAEKEVVEEASSDAEVSEEDNSAAELVEAIEKGDVHVCPLCETILAEELSDELVENHIEFVAGLLSEDASDEDSEDVEK